MQTYCGYIALLGKANAGKSTLLNACLGQKIVGVSKRPQTTRNRILGIQNHEPYQIIFVDTPGMHNTARQPRLNQLMNRTAWSATADAAVICYLVDSKLGWSPQDESYVSRLLQQTAAPILVLGTKIDSVKKAQVKASLAAIAAGMERALTNSRQGKADSAAPPGAFVQMKPWPLSAKRPESVAALTEKLRSFLPAHPWLFAADDLTDKSENFIVSEMIREQLFRQLGQELPFGVSVCVDQLLRQDELVHIKATIITNRKSHKPMIIGHGGQVIKNIGSKARQTLESHFATKVFLELHVKVAEHWVDNPQLIAEFQQLEDLA